MVRRKTTNEMRFKAVLDGIHLLPNTVYPILLSGNPNPGVAPSPGSGAPVTSESTPTHRLPDSPTRAVVFVVLPT